MASDDCAKEQLKVALRDSNSIESDPVDVNIRPADGADVRYSGAGAAAGAVILDVSRVSRFASCNTPFATINAQLSARKYGNNLGVLSVWQTNIYLYCRSKNQSPIMHLFF